MTRKLKLDLDGLTVESFAPTTEQREGGTVRGYLTAYYELCMPGQTGERTCTCEPTCNAATCYNCGSAACPSNGCTNNPAACTGTCYPVSAPVTGCPYC
jgi:hypothetical protein